MSEPRTAADRFREAAAFMPTKAGVQSSPALSPSSVADFAEAVDGARGALDAWLEVHNEAEIRAHVWAYGLSSVSKTPPPLSFPAMRLVAFRAALNGAPRQLDVWMEPQTEASIRDHIRAYAAEVARAAPPPAAEPLHAIVAEALRVAERHCPCGARPESPLTHPHVPGCSIARAVEQLGRLSGGWAIVPRDATPAMDDAHRMHGDTSDWWTAVLTAAEKPETTRG